MNKYVIHTVAVENNWRAVLDLAPILNDGQITNNEIIEFFANGPDGRVATISARGEGAALATALNAAKSLVAPLAQEFGDLLELHFVGAQKSAAGFHLVVGPDEGEVQFVGITTNREADGQSMIAAIQRAVLNDL